jgi:hypothetical protein
VFDFAEAFTNSRLHSFLHGCFYVCSHVRKSQKLRREPRYISYRQTDLFPHYLFHGIGRLGGSYILRFPVRVCTVNAV